MITGKEKLSRAEIFLQEKLWEDFLTTKFALWIDTRSSIDNTLHGSILLQIEKTPETNGGDLMCYVFSLEDAVAHLSVTNPCGILMIEK